MFARLRAPPASRAVSASRASFRYSRIWATVFVSWSFSLRVMPFKAFSVDAIGSICLRRTFGASPVERVPIAGTAGASFDATCGFVFAGLLCFGGFFTGSDGTGYLRFRLHGNRHLRWWQVGGRGLGLARRRVLDWRRKRLVLRDLGFVNAPRQQQRQQQPCSAPGAQLHVSNPFVSSTMAGCRCRRPHSVAASGMRSENSVPRPTVIVRLRFHGATAKYGTSWPVQCRCRRSWL